jgi:thioredoxin:protein disulfide reductase
MRGRYSTMKVAWPLRVVLTMGVIVPALVASPHAQPDLSVTITPVVETNAVHPGTVARVALRMRLGPGLHVQSDRPLDPALIPTVLTLEPPAGIVVEEIVYPRPVELKQEGVAQPLAVFEQEFVIGVAMRMAPDLPPGDHTVHGKLRFQACDDKLCYVPQTRALTIALRAVPAGVALARENDALFRAIAFGRGTRPGTPAPAPPPVAAPASGANEDRSNALPLLDRFTVVSTTGGYLNAKDFMAFLRTAERGGEKNGFFEGRGPLAILLLTLVGGLALNLTPCVLPMIPINLAIIGAGAKAGSRSRGFLLGGAYGAAMAVVYGVLGLVVILTAGSFGVINSSPWFNLAIAIVFVALGLAMFDVFFIDFSAYGSSLAFGSSSRGSFLVAFAMGAIAALLAGACVAPVVIQVILFSSNLYAAGAHVALLLPFVLGVGMALPWPVAGAGLARLPKPGPWMVRVKQAFGVFIFATAAYYAYASYEIFASRWVDTAAVASSVDEKIKEGWHPSLTSGLRAAEAENKLVLVDVWATWCKNCLTMDQTTFKDPEVVRALSDYVKVKFQAEDLTASPYREVLKRFDGVGLPTYAVLRPKAAPTAR